VFSDAVSCLGDSTSHHIKAGGAKATHAHR